MVEKLKCENCGLDLQYLELRMADSDLKNNELYLEELWECPCCEKVVVMELYGKLERVEKYVR